MTTESQHSPRGARIVRALLIAIGIGLVTYALSDQPFYGGAPGIGLLQKLIFGAGAAILLGALLPARHSEKLLLVTISGLLMLGVTEMLGNAVLGPIFRPIYQEDSKLIFSLIPNRTSTMTLPPVNGGATITHRINAAGFRGAELLERQPKRPRVVVYGDSFIHAFYSSDEDTFVSQLQSALKSKTGSDIEVVNAGVSSYGPDQISLKMQRELPQVQPDLLVVAIFAGNDYGDLMRNKMFRMSSGGVLSENGWQLDPAVSEAFQLSQRESILVRALRTTLGRRRSPAASSPDGATPEMGFLVAEAEREYRSLIGGDPVVRNTHIDYYSADVSLLPDSESARYKVALMRAVLDRIRMTADTAKVPVVFLFIPHPADLSDTYDWGAVDELRYPDYDPRNQIAPLERHAIETSSHFVSLFDDFRANDPNRLYLHGGDDHWNPAGQALAASRVAEYVTAQELLQRP